MLQFCHPRPSQNVICSQEPFPVSDLSELMSHYDRLAGYNPEKRETPQNTLFCGPESEEPGRSDLTVVFEFRSDRGTAKPLQTRCQFQFQGTLFSFCNGSHGLLLSQLPIRDTKLISLSLGSRGARRRNSERSFLWLSLRHTEIFREVHSLLHWT